MTIARAKSTVNRNFKKKVGDVLAKLPNSPITFEPEYISVMRSELTNIGPKYSELARIVI